MEKLLKKNNKTIERQEIGKLVMSPRIDARELEKYLGSKPNDPPQRQKQIELPSITASRQQDTFFDYPKYTKIDKLMPQTRY